METQDDFSALLELFNARDVVCVIVGLSQPERSGASVRSYYLNAREDLLDMLPAIPESVLDVGCATGATLSAFKKQGSQFLAGIESNREVAAGALEVTDHIWVGDVERFPLDTFGRRFDCILFGDVLEHLVWPEDVVRRLSGLLNPGGCVLASIPNARFYKLSFPLLFLGRFRYADEGILDRTHLRFFTRDSLAGLFSAFRIEKIRPYRGRVRDLANGLTLSLFSDILTQQYYVLARNEASSNDSQPHTCAR